MREAGLKVKRFEQGYSTAVAAISFADWALEFPHPIPPKLHVSLFCCRPGSFTIMLSTMLSKGQSFCCQACMPGFDSAQLLADR